MIAASYRLMRRSWVGRNAVLILTLLAFISLSISYLYITQNQTPLSIKPRRMWTLLTIDLALLALPIGIIAVRVFTLWAALRTGLPGSRLQRRIVTLFSLVAIMPTIFVSLFSAVFFNLGIQTWFNDRVQTAVGESLVVAEAYLAEHKENIRADALAMASDLNQSAYLAETDPAEFNRTVATQSALRVLTESIVFQHNQIIAQGRLSFALAFERIPQDAMERASRGEVVITTTDDDKVRALVKLDALPDAYLLVGRLVDSKVLAHMESAQGAVHEYENLKEQLNRWQLIFSIVFVALALLLLLSSIGYGMVFASRLTIPISDLAGAAERVRGGDFSTRVSDTQGKDEIGMLARAFNRMTEQLQAQRGDLIEANRRLDERRRFSDTVLSGVSAGVIALDSEKKITLFNRSSTAILSAIDQPISEQDNIVQLLPGIDELLAAAEHVPGEVANNTLTLNRNNKTITLHVRVTVEKMGDEIEGFIVTFDDITLLVSAQRTAAWADVARKVAHEIKNPLTPIQLAAERLKRKYHKLVGAEEEETFIKYTDTIIRHVGDIGKMVEEFVSFARMPTPVFANTDLTALLKKALFSTQVSNAGFDYVFDAPAEPVMFVCDERQMNQVMTNLLKNAAESVEARLANNPAPKGAITLKLAREGEEIKILVEDNGIGFPTDMKKMLEPYVTTRTKGTGLGLAIVKKITEDHKGKINLENNPAGGARVMLSFLQQCDI